MSKEQAYTDRTISWFPLLKNHGPKTKPYMEDEKPYMEDESAYLPVSLKLVNQLELVLCHLGKKIRYASPQRIAQVHEYISRKPWQNELESCCKVDAADGWELFLELLGNVDFILSQLYTRFNVTDFLFFNFFLFLEILQLGASFKFQTAMSC